MSECPVCKSEDSISTGIIVDNLEKVESAYPEFQHVIRRVRACKNCGVLRMVLD